MGDLLTEEEAARLSELEAKFSGLGNSGGVTIDPIGGMSDEEVAAMDANNPRLQELEEKFGGTLRQLTGASEEEDLKEAELNSELEELRSIQDRYLKYGPWVEGLKTGGDIATGFLPFAGIPAGAGWRIGVEELAQQLEMRPSQSFLSTVAQDAPNMAIDVATLGAGKVLKPIGRAVAGVGEFATDTAKSLRKSLFGVTSKAEDAALKEAEAQSFKLGKNISDVPVKTDTMVDTLVKDGILADGVAPKTLWKKIRGVIGKIEPEIKATFKALDAEAAQKGVLPVQIDPNILTQKFLDHIQVTPTDIDKMTSLFEKNLRKLEKSGSLNTTFEGALDLKRRYQHSAFRGLRESKGIRDIDAKSQVDRFLSQVFSDGINEGLLRRGDDAADIVAQKFAKYSQYVDANNFIRHSLAGSRSGPVEMKRFKDLMFGGRTGKGALASGLEGIGDFLNKGEDFIDPLGVGIQGLGVGLETGAAQGVLRGGAKYGEELQELFSPPDVSPSMTEDFRVEDPAEKDAVSLELRSLYADDTLKRARNEKALRKGEPLDKEVVTALGGRIPDKKSLEDSFLEQVEGFRYKPYNDANRGIAIGTGTNLGQQSVDGLRDLGVPESTIQKISHVVGVEGKAAVNKLARKPLNLTEAEVEDLDTLVKENLRNNVRNRYEEATGGSKIDDLPEEARAVVYSLSHNLGNKLYKGDYSKAWNAIVKNDWGSLVKSLSKLKDVPSRRKQEVALLMPLVSDVKEAEGLNARGMIEPPGTKVIKFKDGTERRDWDA